jgi:ParB family chromosome partitioning protein
VATKFGLGRGLDALLPPLGQQNNEAQSDIADFMVANAAASMPLPDAATVQDILLDAIRPNPVQPRQDFNLEELENLAASIKTYGVIQPVIVEEDGGGGYFLVAGERRKRAAEIAGLLKIPALVRTYSDALRLEVALIENVQRADLNPVEEALAFRQIMDNSQLSQEETAVKLGVSRSALANTLRLLKLPEEIQLALRAEKITSGHARAILSLNDKTAQMKLYHKITEGGLSVREAERLAAETTDPKAGKKSKGADEHKIPRDPDLDAKEQKFIEVFGTKVHIDGDFSGGTVKISYFSSDDLDRIYEIVSHSES